MVRTQIYLNEEEVDILYSLITKAELYSGVRPKEEEKVFHEIRKY